MKNTHINERNHFSKDTNDILKGETKMSKEMENKVGELKEELEGKKEVVVDENNKVRKVITYALKGLALVATGLIGFFVGQHVGGDKDENDAQEEKTEE